MGTQTGRWSHRAYRRLDTVAEAPQRSRRRWRIRIRRPKLRLLRRALSAPVRILARIRDAYVRMMLRLASSSALGGGSGFPNYSAGFERPALKEYDEKVIVEIYKSLVAQGHVLVSTGKDGVPTAQIISSRRQDQVPSLSH